jgi:hypothetical protein
VQLYWDIDNSCFNWFMRTAAAKWRDFKSDLRKVFDDDMEYEELLELRDERVHEDWKWLIDHWMSPDRAVSYNSLFLELLYMNHEYYK